jgi:hypothetical protein
MRLKLVSALASLAVATLFPLCAATPAAAEPKAGYLTAQAEYYASARTVPYLTWNGSNTYNGYVLHDPGMWTGNQTVAVGCWFDGDWATGNYSTNRWFKVYVSTSYWGSGHPGWNFVHASYVFNQPRVPHCVQTSTGVWLPDGQG